MTYDAGTKEAGHSEPDPWKQADEAKEPTRHYFGQVYLDLWFCVLEKGVGKVPFDPAQHKPGQKRTAIKVELVPLQSSGLMFTILREMIAESREWAGIVLPSLKALDVTTRTLHEKFVQAELVPSRKYVDKETGETKQATTFKFVQIFESESECEAAAAEFFNQPQDEIPGFSDESKNEKEPKLDPQKEVALKFLPALVNMAGGDPQKLSSILSENQLVSRYFTINSPEVVELLLPGKE